MQRPLGSKAQIISNIRGQEEEEVAVVVEVEEVAEEVTIEVVIKEIIIMMAKDTGGIMTTMGNLEKMEEMAKVMGIEEEVDTKIMKRPISKSKKENFMKIKITTIEVVEVAEAVEEEEVEEAMVAMVEMEVILNTIRKKKNSEVAPLKVPN